MLQFNYGAIGNCRSAALISEQGSIDWFCFPDFDSPSVFAKILDEKKGGCFAFKLDNTYRVSQAYIPHTNILCTSYESLEGAFDVLDFMPRYKTGDIKDYYLPPEIYRLLRLKRGSPRFRVIFEPALNYGREKAVYTFEKDCVKIFSQENEMNTMYFYSSLDTTRVLTGKEFTLIQNEYFLLSYNQKLVKINRSRVDLEYQRTKIYWLNWSNRSRKYLEYNDLIERSILVLKLMSYQLTGAVLAALTTSLPESIGEERNWDYRFCWLRDASMSIETLIRIGHQGAAKKFINFIHNILKNKSDTFQIMYSIRGEKILLEEQLTHLSGYKNSRPVRIGNNAYHQKQNDSFGYLMDVIYQYYLFFPDTLDAIEEMYEMVKGIVKTVMDDWQKPDKGIWEIRGNEKHFVFSKVMCWVALDRAVKIASMVNDGEKEAQWKAIADNIREDIFEHGWKEEIQSFSQTYCNLALDASLLLLETYGFIDANDHRYRKTVDAIYNNLEHNGLMYRYKNADDFGVPTSAFTICTFWMIQALYSTGRKEDARQLFDQIISYSNHLGLFSEDLDFETKSQLGNFPQAYSHLAFINTAILFTEEIKLSRFIKP
ncbi:MAG: glycoside hydrolase [Porphyromonadaceae bacterium CG2_30_38_12]|nr:MAG: glycoside hydrolase [Porphyromonadaceae bacterium CG2_30_38_12]